MRWRLITPTASARPLGTAPGDARGKLLDPVASSRDLPAAPQALPGEVGVEELEEVDGVEAPQGTAAHQFGDTGALEGADPARPSSGRRASMVVRTICPVHRPPAPPKRFRRRSTSRMVLSPVLPGWTRRGRTAAERTAGRS